MSDLDLCLIEVEIPDAGFTDYVFSRMFRRDGPGLFQPARHQALGSDLI
jgi:hypothetical protein